MRYGRYLVEDYERDNPHDDRVHEAKADIARLNEREWKSFEGEEPIDFRRRVEQSFDILENNLTNPQRDQDERRGAREVWIQEKSASLRQERRLENESQSDERLKVGGQVARSAEIEQFEKEAREGKNAELNKSLDDLTDRQAARQEFISNEVVAPAREAKLRDLGLNEVKEEQRGPEPEYQAEPSSNDHHILDDVMVKSGEPGPADDDRLERLRKARETIESPPASREDENGHYPEP